MLRFASIADAARWVASTKRVPFEELVERMRRQTERDELLD